MMHCTHQWRSRDFSLGSPEIKDQANIEILKIKLKIMISYNNTNKLEDGMAFLATLAPLTMPVP